MIKGNEIIKGNSSPGLSTRYEHHETVNQGIHHVHTGGNYDSQLIIPITLIIKALKSC